jgi:hypothetical protein
VTCVGLVAFVATVFRLDDCAAFESYFRIHDPLLLADRRVGEIGRVAFGARGVSASHIS